MESYDRCWKQKNIHFLILLEIFVNAKSNLSLDETKRFFRGFWQSETPISLLSYRDLELEKWNFPCNKFRYYTVQKANNKGAAQTGQCLCCSQTPEDRFSCVEAHHSCAIVLNQTFENEYGINWAFFSQVRLNKLLSACKLDWKLPKQLKCAYTQSIPHTNKKLSSLIAL